MGYGWDDLALRLLPPAVALWPSPFPTSDGRVGEGNSRSVSDATLSALHVRFVV